MNYGGFIVIALGLLLIIIGARGSQKALLPSIFGTPSTPATPTVSTNATTVNTPTLTLSTPNNVQNTIIPLNTNQMNTGMLYL